MTHNNITCTKYNEPVLPDEQGNCSLCGAKTADEIKTIKIINIYEVEIDSNIEDVEAAVSTQLIDENMIGSYIYEVDQAQREVLEEIEELL